MFLFFTTFLRFFRTKYSFLCYLFTLNVSPFFMYDTILSFKHQFHVNLSLFSEFIPTNFHQDKECSLFSLLLIQVFFFFKICALLNTWPDLFSTPLPFQTEKRTAH